MRRFVTILGVALFAYALLPSFAQAQVIIVQPRTYVTPIVVGQPVQQTYYYAPSVTTYSARATYSYYPSGTVVYSQSAAPTVVTYSAPPTVFVPATGVITTHTSYGYGVFRPRGYYSQSYYTPLP